MKVVSLQTPSLVVIAPLLGQSVVDSAGYRPITSGFRRYAPDSSDMLSNALLCPNMSQADSAPSWPGTTCHSGSRAAGLA